MLGFEVHDIRQRERGFCAARLEAFGQLAAWLLVTPWGESLESVRREAIRSAADHSARWSIVMDGRFVRLIDPQRSFARRYLEFDLSQTIEDEASFEAFWGTLRAEALSAASSGRSTLDEILIASERHAVGVCRSLREGVLEALVALLNGAVDRHRQRRRQRQAEAAFVSTLHEQCLTIVYRILFLLFAEARTLVPLWHPLFRAGYSIESIRALAEDPMRPARALGGASGDLPSRASRLPRGRSRRDAVQRPALRAGTDCRRRSDRGRRRRGARGDRQLVVASGGAIGPAARVVR